jgi:hypothetical protein
MMRLRRVYLVTALGVVGALAACTLNPQPLPPKDNNEATFGDGGFTTAADSGSAASKTGTDAARDPNAPPPDGQAPASGLDDGGLDGGLDDGGLDGGDGGDAS